MQKIANIEILRFPLALFVVMEHTLSQYMANGSLYTPYIFFDAFLRGNSVPVFFFISGYLFFYGITDFNTSTWKRKLHNRVHTLFIPYIIWNTFAIILVWITLYAGMGHYMANAESFSPTIENLLKCFWMYDGMLAGSLTPSIYPINVALWYVRNLILLSILTPVIYFVIRRNMTIMLTLCIIFGGFTYDSSLFFFTVGSYFSIKGHNIQFNNKYINIYSLCMYIFSGIALLYGQYNKELEYIIKQINILAFVPLVLWLSSKMKQNNITAFLSSASCLIYFAHQPICGKINKMTIALLQPTNSSSEFLINILAVTTTVCVITFAYYISKYKPTVLYILTGKTNKI